MVFSNSVAVNLGVPALEITASGSICDNGTVTISSTGSSPGYTYTLFRNGAQAATGTTADFTVTEPGSYYIIANTGSCNATSNTIIINEFEFSISTTVPAAQVLIPGEQVTLSVATNAVEPVYLWYRNNVLIEGANTNAYTATSIGTYKVTISQSEGCAITQEAIFTITNPLGFIAQIAAASDYTSCSSSTTTISMVSLQASTPQGQISVSGNSYSYQWYKNNIAMAGAISQNVTIAENGTYTLEVIIPGWGAVISNAVEILLGLAETPEVLVEGTYCSEGSEVQLFSTVDNPQYTYKWYKEGSNTPIGTTTSITVSTSGNYYLEVTYLGCTRTSEAFALTPAETSNITIDAGAEVQLPEGTSVIINASGADSYQWYRDSVLFATGPSAEITEPGNYNMTATLGQCVVVKEFTVNLVENNVVAIPNIVTPNNDGINDKWVLPLEYIGDDIEIMIYAPDGSLVFRSYSYRGNWPETDFNWSLKNPVYYYTIMKGLEYLRRGSITILK
ncbi:hypothetical protein CHU92_03805 [Flavobacterium cyanobacteriorum]|uniref:Ig-like domain-containing protein n=1 Tax=Flavobacterium cyanobacteriorum TaxID=2022802 RepID=A0A255ZQ53_9FLAO|nr:gliding motility-associated C-terminal domain-containing protein [Flavobacterium cyanobacteriorum]OYQ42810.1 hypothetical protein CHU92_03805 [Flavobacterium cyanobacteriorum]